ncbi:MAG TPA: hypothetical protein VNL74_05590 [Methylococcus sp.]|nr:hypothetical protein [Methylococcus sp.]
MHKTAHRYVSVERLLTRRRRPGLGESSRPVWGFRHSRLGLFPCYGVESTNTRLGVPWRLGAIREEGWYDISLIKNWVPHSSASFGFRRYPLMLLAGSFAVFTLVAVMGLMMACDVWRGIAVGSAYALAHGAAALLGSALVIYAALTGDTRLYLNIAMAVVILALGAWMGLLTKRGKRIPRLILIAHAGLAVACYAVLGFFVFNPHATLI